MAILKISPCSIRALPASRCTWGTPRNDVDSFFKKAKRDSHGTVDSGNPQRAHGRPRWEKCMYKMC